MGEYILTSNDEKVLNCLREYGMLTRTELAEKTGLHRSTTYDALTRLRLKGLIEEVSKPRPAGRLGRKNVYFKVKE
jgi:DNA-binding IclR family transcriptional regulator